jgi:UDP-N-acetylglucosamine diphosphorylase/glucosamine-1-phosphate N-acetyltransferase
MQIGSKFETIILFEDELSRSARFLPLTCTRAISELRSGVYTNVERIRKLALSAKIVLHARAEIAEVVRERYTLAVNEIPESGSALFLNSRVALTKELCDEIEALQIGESLVDESQTSKSTVAIWLENIPDKVRAAVNSGKPISNWAATSTKHTSTKLYTAIWEIVLGNAASIRSDFALFTEEFSERPTQSLIASGVHVSNPAQIHIAKSAVIGAGVVLDATDGPIIIQDGVRIMPNTTIMGPAVICKDSIVKIGAKIYEGTTIGPVSKVGGEIENSIILGYSNKQHDGYLGHSYLGAWVNLGADTNTSDLKNDYSPVRVEIAGEIFETNSLFVGLLMGDHSKSAINTQFNTGTAVGVSANIFGAGFPPKWIESFSWGGAETMTTYKLDKAIEVARTVMLRRGQSLSRAEEAMLRALSKKQDLQD